ncbi:MAG TPA: histidine kinase [Candidatus Dormibacteraeota bacterium]|nr:histidine kinase [Candidatus Dormibacteraeota bacterium]
MLAYILTGVVLAAVAAYVPLVIAVHDPVAIGLPGGWPADALAFTAAGVLVARRRPEHPAGWALIAVAATLVVMTDGSLYTIFDYRLHGGGTPLGPLAILLGLLWVVAIPLIPVVVLLFPDARLPSSRWRPAVRVYLALAALCIAGLYLVATSEITGPHIAINRSTGDLADFDAPSGALGALYTGWAGVTVVGCIAAVRALVISYRRSGGDERQQLKWFILGAGVTISAVVVVVVLSGFNLPQDAPIEQGARAYLVLALAVLPASIGVGILKYRLYDIDVVVNRALVYGALAAFVTAVYAGIAVGLGSLVGRGGGSNLALSIAATAVVAVGFEPLRQRLQRLSNRLVYGRRSTPYEALAELSEHISDSLSVDDVLARMAQVVAEATAAARADIWLRDGEVLRVATSWPSQAASRDPITVDGASRPPANDQESVFPVRHQDEVLGAITVTKHSREALTPVERNVLTHLANQAAQLLKKHQLTGDLRARVEELRESRRRLVTARDEERRRLERDLHDGAQQHLVAIKVRLALAAAIVDRDPELAKTTLDQLQAESDEALQDLRELARGVYPPSLAEHGILAALRSHTRRAQVAVDIDADGVARYSQDVEAAVYFCVLEALQNVQKHAGASRVVLRLAERNGDLHFEVDDDGRGFDAGSTRRGTGLVNMADRLDALGGALHVRSRPGEGTQLRGAVPTQRRS